MVEDDGGHAEGMGRLDVGRSVVDEEGQGLREPEPVQKATEDRGVRLGKTLVVGDHQGLEPVHKGNRSGANGSVSADQFDSA